MDGLICEIYIAHVTPGGAKRLDQGDFGSDPSVLRMGTVPLRLYAPASATVPLLTSQLNRITCKSSLKGKMRMKQQLEAANRDSVRDPHPTIHLSLRHISKGSTCILMSRSVCVWPRAFI